MSLSLDLLEQAFHLALREPKRPRQASLRRAISSAYYALFHLLISAVASRFVSTNPTGLRELVQRALAHGEMKTVCKGFVAGNAAFVKSSTQGSQSQSKDIPSATQRILSFPIEPDLIIVMNAFIELQEARHTADYDTTTSWNRVNVLTKIASVKKAFDAWARVKNAENAIVFMAALLLQKHWGR